MIELNKPLPSSYDSEKVILGAVMIDNTLIAQATELLKEEDFYSPLHRRVFRAMTSLFESGNKIDPILIGEELKKTDSLESLGGIASITQLTFGLPHFSDIEPYAKVVKDKAEIRQLIHTSGEVYSMCLSEEFTHTEIVEFLESKLQNTSVSTSNFISQSGRIKPIIEIIQQRARSETNTLGLSTGFSDLDVVTSGLCKKDLIVIAARPSMGKTSIALDIARNVTEANNDLVVAFFSLEMDGKEMIPIRLLSQEAKVDMSRLRNGFLTKEEWGRLAMAGGSLQNRIIEVDDLAGLSFPQIRAKSLRLKAEKKRLDLIIIDHLLLIARPNKKDDRLEIGHISLQCKELAKNLDVPVILLHQLSRKPEDRKDKRPIMSDLGESGQIEQNVDLCLLMYRGEYYFKDDADLKGKAEIIVGKNRNGPTPTVKVSYMDFCSSFRNYTL